MLIYGEMIRKACTDGRTKLKDSEVRAVAEIRVDGYLHEYIGDADADDYSDGPVSPYSRRIDRPTPTDKQVVSRVVKRIIGNVAWDDTMLRAVRLWGGIGKLPKLVAGRLKALREAIKEV